MLKEFNRVWPRSKVLRDGVQWIAENDEGECLDAEEIESFISTVMLADIMFVSPRDVANAVVTYRLNKRGKKNEIHN